MHIAIGSDHAGYDHKQRLVEQLTKQGHRILDLGTDSAAPCDYPAIAQAVGEAVAGRTAEGGILICGTGVGMSIVANKIPGVRASLCTTELMAHDTRSHNDSNVLVLSARVNPVETNLRLAEVWVNTGRSSVERHRRRVDQIAEIEKKYLKM